MFINTKNPLFQMTIPNIDENIINDSPLIEKKVKSDKENFNLCKGCTKCCEYIAIQLDEPEDIEAFDNIRWYLYHKNVRVFVTDEDDWFVQFLTPCKAISPIDGKCMAYAKRPSICRDHKQETCEKYAQESEEKVSFIDPDTFIKWAHAHYNFD